MTERIVVSLHVRLGGSEYLPRALAAKKRADALGATMSAWGADTLVFDFAAEEIEEAIGLALATFDEAHTPEARFSAGVAYGDLARIGPAGTLAWGEALATAWALSGAAEPGEVLVDEACPPHVRNALRVQGERRFGAKTALVLDTRQPLRRDTLVDALHGEGETKVVVTVPPLPPLPALARELLDRPPAGRDKRGSEPPPTLRTSRPPATGDAFGAGPISSDMPAITLEPISSDAPSITVAPVSSDAPSITVAPVSSDAPPISVEPASSDAPISSGPMSSDPYGARDTREVPVPPVASERFGARSTREVAVPPVSSGARSTRDVVVPAAPRDRFGAARPASRDRFGAREGTAPQGPDDSAHDLPVSVFSLEGVVSGETGEVPVPSIVGSGASAAEALELIVPPPRLPPARMAPSVPPPGFARGSSSVPPLAASRISWPGGSDEYTELAAAARQALLKGNVTELERLSDELKTHGDHGDLAERMAGFVAWNRGAKAEGLRKLRHAADAETRPAHRVRALLAYGVALAASGRTDAALLAALGAIARAREVEDRQGEHVCARFLARLSAASGYERAARTWAQIAEEVGPPRAT